MWVILDAIYFNVSIFKTHKLGFQDIAAYETSFAHAGMKQWQWYIIHLVRSTYKF